MREQRSCLFCSNINDFVFRSPYDDALQNQSRHAPVPQCVCVYGDRSKTDSHRGGDISKCCLCTCLCIFVFVFVFCYSLSVLINSSFEKCLFLAVAIFDFFFCGNAEKNFFLVFLYCPCVCACVFNVSCPDRLSPDGSELLETHHTCCQDSHAGCHDSFSR